MVKSSFTLPSTRIKRNYKMSNPEKIYRWEEPIGEIFIQTKYSDVPFPEHAIEYLRGDIHEAEVNALKAEIAALKAPPVILSTGDVTEEGDYRWRPSDTAEWRTISVCFDWRKELQAYFFGDEEEEPIKAPLFLGSQFIGPIKYPEV